MDKSQFQFPTGEHSDAINRARLDALRDTPEKLTEGPFKIIKVIENTIFDRRATAVAIEQTKGRFATIPYLNIKVKLPVRPKEEIYRELIEKERQLGAKIHGGNGFFLDYKGSSVVSDTVADWHLEFPDASDPVHPQHVHIETTDRYLRKFHKDGRPYDMTIQDIERFVPSVYYYAQETLALYPFSQDFEDILNEVAIPDDIAALLPITPEIGRKSDYDVAA
ncbi:MAG: hypothetical protein ACREGE_02760 [Candidatus Microsaccharimonas sp.]